MTSLISISINHVFNSKAINLYVHGLITFSFFQQTHSTRVRIAIMAAFGDSYVRDNPGAKFRLVTHEPRPALTLIPPASIEKRPMTFKFIDAVQRLVPNFTKSDWAKIYDRVGARLHLNQLRRTFVILSDDDRHLQSSNDAIVSGPNALPVAPVGVGRGAMRGRGGGVPGVSTRKRAADQEVTQPTPSKSSRGRH